MTEIDEFASGLLEEAKRFLEKAKNESSQDAKDSYCHASLLLGFSALEAHLNAIADELASWKDLDVLDRSILLEKEYALDNGAFVLKDKLKMYRFEDRILHMFSRFTSGGLPKSDNWWSQIKSAVTLRNQLVHPKVRAHVTEAAVGRALQAILDCLQALYSGIFKKKYPAHRRGLNSNLDF